MSGRRQFVGSRFRKAQKIGTASESAGHGVSDEVYEVQTSKAVVAPLGPKVGCRVGDRASGEDEEESFTSTKARGVIFAFEAV